ncbi:hypothetical protein BDN72DRAFT_858095 [Pluteus cervinus]|uniref:Uncharacterized protein n=1 Tax=Pluteus cervinus TaxID=181527 RepID=A0ACD3AUC2_9AGAR|nr:hypothetical protein BDN72DRAFT_858095 [Pluteus cervinus]
MHLLTSYVPMQSTALGIVIYLSLTSYKANDHSLEAAMLEGNQDKPDWEMKPGFKISPACKHNVPRLGAGRPPPSSIRDLVTSLCWSRLLSDALRGLWTTLIGSPFRLEICNSLYYAWSQHLVSLYRKRAITAYLSHFPQNQMSTYHQETAVESDEDIGELHEVQENGSQDLGTSAQSLRTLTDLQAGRLNNESRGQESATPGTDNGDQGQTAISSGLILATAAALYGLVLASVVALRGIFPLPFAPTQSASVANRIAPRGGATRRGRASNRPPVASDPYDADDEEGF